MMISILLVTFLGWWISSSTLLTPLTLANSAVIEVEIARTPQELALGLMGRSELAPDHGMLFILGEEKIHRFWMKNTLIPLDIIWLDRHKRVVYIRTEVPPCQSDPCPFYGPLLNSLYVLEINSGMAKRQKIRLGDLFHFDDPGNKQ